MRCRTKCHGLTKDAIVLNPILYPSSSHNIVLQQWLSLSKLMQIHWNLRLRTYAQCALEGLFVRLPRTSRLTWGFSQVLCLYFKRQLRPTWSVGLRTPTWQPSMPREWPSCPRTFSLLAVSEAREPKFSLQQQTTPGDLNHHQSLL